MPPQLWDWAVNQGPTIVILTMVIYGMTRGKYLVPGYAYEREKERADRLEGLLLRNVRATERMAEATETMVKSGGA